MKNTILTTTLGLFLTASAFAQGGFIRLDGGFGFSATNDSYIGTNFVKDSLGSKTTSKSNFYGTSGQGPVVRLAGGYMFNKNFGLELQLYYMFGMYHDIGRTTYTQYDDRLQERSSQLRAVPSIIVDGGFEKLSPYARFGVMLPLAGKTVQYQTIRNEKTSTLNEWRLDAYGAFSVGFEASAGLRYNVTPNLSIRAEAYFAALRVKSDRAEVVINRISDLEGNLIQDYLETAAVYATQINFVDELNAESNTFEIPAAVPNFDQEKPMDILAQRGNYSSFGINIGLQYVFGKKE